MAGSWQALMASSWRTQTHGGCMAYPGQARGRPKRAHAPVYWRRHTRTSQARLRRMASAWQANGGRMASSWQAHGKLPMSSDTWWAHGMPRASTWQTHACTCNAPARRRRHTRTCQRRSLALAVWPTSGPPAPGSRGSPTKAHSDVANQRWPCPRQPRQPPDAQPKLTPTNCWTRWTMTRRLLRAWPPKQPPGPPGG